MSFSYVLYFISIMPLSHYDHESQESPRIDNFQDSWGFVIPLLHYDHESHKFPRIDNFLDSWLNRYQFVKFLPVSYIHLNFVKANFIKTNNSLRQVKFRSLIESFLFKLKFSWLSRSIYVKLFMCRSIFCGLEVKVSS